MAFAKDLNGKVYKDENGDKVLTTDFEKLPNELWNSSTVMAYMDWLNFQKYGKYPTTKGFNLQQARAFIKRDLDTYGTAVLKEFLRRAVRAYKGNLAYPTLSYPQAMMLYKEKLMKDAIDYTVATKVESETDMEGLEW